MKRLRSTAAVSVVSFAMTMGHAAILSAAPIDLNNDVGVNWSDAPCSVLRPDILCGTTWSVIGAPRFVPDAITARDSLTVNVDFLGVGLDIPLGSPPGTLTPLFLNVFDADANPVLRTGTNTQLALQHLFAPTGLATPIEDVLLTLGSFQDFDLLPSGDLIFTIAFNPRFGIIDSSPDRPDKAVIITMAGPGSEIQVPEPATLGLLLVGLAATGLSRRFSKRT